MWEASCRHAETQVKSGMADQWPHNSLVVGPLFLVIPIIVMKDYLLQNSTKC